MQQLDRLWDSSTALYCDRKRNFDILAEKVFCFWSVYIAERQKQKNPYDTSAAVIKCGL